MLRRSKKLQVISDNMCIDIYNYLWKIKVKKIEQTNVLSFSLLMGEGYAGI